MRKTLCWLALSLLCAPLAAFAASAAPADVPSAAPGLAAPVAAPAPAAEPLFQPIPLSTVPAGFAGLDFRGFGVCSQKCNFNCLIGVPASCPAGDGFCVLRCG